MPSMPWTGSSWPGLSLPAASPFLPSTWGRGLPPTDTHICTTGLWAAWALAGIPQGPLEAAAAVRGQDPSPSGVQELLHVGQQRLAGREEAGAEPQQLPAPLLAVPVATEPSVWTLQDQLPAPMAPLPDAKKAFTPRRWQRCYCAHFVEERAEG